MLNIPSTLMTMMLSPPLLGNSSIWCCRLPYRCDYDEQLIWHMVKRHGGRIEVYDDHVLFWMQREWYPLLADAITDLERNPILDNK